jgi:hypothetical protein
VHEKLEPRLREALPRPFNRARFARCSLGKGVPQFGNVEVTHHADDHVQVELDLSYSSDADILLDAGAGGISFGISHLKLSGRLCLALNHLQSTWPVIGAVQLFFPNAPRVELKFAGLADIASDVGLAQKVQDVVEEMLWRSAVLPNSKTFQFVKDEHVLSVTEARSREPIGVLRVQILRARNLAGTHWKWGHDQQFTSDPYCKLRLGSSTARTGIVRGATNPEWQVGEANRYLLVHHLDQELEIDVLDEDSGFVRRKYVSCLGSMIGVSVRSLLSLRASRLTSEDGTTWGHCIKLDTSKVNKGMLDVNDPVNLGVPSELDIAVEWMDIKAPHADLPHLSQLMPGPSVAPGAPDGLLHVELHSGNGFPEEHCNADIRWQCRLDYGSSLQSDHKPEPALLSQKGKPHIEQPDYTSVPLNPSLFIVIDSLIARRVPLEEIASIIGSMPEIVAQYLQLKLAFDEECNKRRLAQHRCVEMRWHQTLSLLVPRSAEANLLIELVQAGKVVGYLDAISVQQVCRDGLPKCSLKLNSTSQTLAEKSKLSSWLFPQCGIVTPVKDPYHAVHMDVSVKFRAVAKGKPPSDVGSDLSDVGSVVSADAKSMEVTDTQEQMPTASTNFALARAGA